MNSSPAPFSADSRYAWVRLMVTLALITVGAAGMYVVPVVLPVVQKEFGVARADASTSYAMLMVGFGVGGLLMGRLADRLGVMVPLMLGAICLGAGFVVAANAGGIWTFNIAHGVLVGLLGSSAAFSPLLADTSLWFVRRRGIAVAICASGNYLGGAIWPPVVQHFVETVGWRQTYLGMAAFCSAAMFALALFMRRRPPVQLREAPAAAAALPSARPFPAAWRCRCRRSTSSPTAATWATARRAARRCSR
jgi:MFS family permease